jgi:cysteinyl-tRNA synthetase
MLLCEGFAVKHVVNYTDVSDETAMKAAGRGISELQLAERCERAFERDMHLLNVLPPDARPKVSEHISDIISMTGALVAKGAAYVSGGGVYLRAYPGGYGALLRRPLVEVIVQGGSDEPGAKASPLDFALWETSPKGRLSWESPWGRGRPGWHIQDCAFINKHLGLPIDIYTGGTDLVFPHHESEILLSNALSGVPMSRFWIHNGHVTSEGAKLSKSKGVRIELASLFKSHGAEAVRYYLMLTHYRDQTRYEPSSLDAAATDFRRIFDCWKKLDGLPRSEGVPVHVPEADDITRRLLSQMANDLRTDLALRELEKLAKLTEAKSEVWDTSERAAVREAWRSSTQPLGILDGYPQELRESAGQDDCDC